MKTLKQEWKEGQVMKRILLLSLILMGNISWSDSFEIVSDFNRRMCLDYNTSSGNVTIWPCTGNANQRWYWHGQQLRSDFNDDCLDAYASSDNVGMWGCHTGDNQKWYWNGETLKNGDGKCLDWNLGNDNIIDYTCHGNANQRWYEQLVLILRPEDVGKAIRVEPDRTTFILGE